MLLFLKNNGFPDLPSDSRTLLETPKSRIVLDVPPGKYIHIGLKNGLDNILSNSNKDNSELYLDFNIDGLPITKSTNNRFWLILCRVYNIPESGVFAVGVYVYCGTQKPSNFRTFLRPHVDELKEITQNYTFREKVIKIQIRA